MREIELSDGSKLDVYPLTRGQLKYLRSQGFDLANLRRDNAEDAMDLVMDMALGTAPVEKLDDLPNTDSMAVFTAILAETYGSRDEEKN